MNYSYKAKKAEFAFTPEEEDRLSPEFRDLVSRVFKVNPRDRMTFEEMLTHPWI
jgi:hypothetical protein